MKYALLIGFISVGVLFAAEPVGTVTSLDTFELRGISVNSAGVPMWPMLVGDDIRTTGSSASIRFRDGSQAVVAANSRVKVDSEGGAVVLRIVNGSAQVTRAPDSNIRVINQVLVQAEMSRKPSGIAPGPPNVNCVRACAIHCPPPASCP